MNVLPIHRPGTMPPRGSQKGAALFVAMIMVLLLLVIAVAGMRTVTLESRIGGNMLQSHTMQEVADGTLREGERTIQAYGISLSQCASDATSVIDGAKPCFLSEAKIDAAGLSTKFGVSTKALGFEKPNGYWYPRHIDCVVPKGEGLSALLKCETGSTEYYEVNAQATSKEKPQPCGADALCLRSSINLFIK